MKRIVIFLCLCLFFLFSSSSVLADNTDVSDTNGYDWNPVLNAIIQVESHGNEKSKNGNSCGVLQITPILVKECNSILKKRKSKKRFKLSDRFSLSKSKDMFLLLQSFYNPTNSIEFAIRSWNGGLHYSVARTQKYLDKVLSYIK